MIYEIIKKTFSTDKKFVCYGKENNRLWGYTTSINHIYSRRQYSCYEIKDNQWYEICGKKVTNKELVSQLDLINNICV